MSADSAVPFIFPIKSRYKPETTLPYLPDSVGDVGFKKEAYDRVRTCGLPTPKLERWKYTNIVPALNMLELNPGSLGWGNTETVSITPPGHEKYQDMMLFDLNIALCSDIQNIQDDAEINIKAEKSKSYNPFLNIELKESQEVIVLEYQGGEQSYWKNMVTSINLPRGSRLKHYRIVEEGAESVYTQNTYVSQAQDSTYESFTLTLGEGLSRNQIHVDLKEKGAHCAIHGVNLLSGDQHADTTITVEHQAPDCTSDQSFKSVITGKAHCVFQGKVHVHQIAQRTDGYQLSNALLLSPTAKMDTKPELEIYADDVKCSHGATTGQLDKDPLFYLRARGIPQNQAKALMIQAFAGALIENLAHEAFKEKAQAKLLKWLEESL